MSVIIKDSATILIHSAFIGFLDNLADITHGLTVTYTTESVTGKTRVNYQLVCETREIAQDAIEKITHARILYG